MPDIKINLRYYTMYIGILHDPEKDLKVINGMYLGIMDTY